MTILIKKRTFQKKSKVKNKDGILRIAVFLTGPRFRHRIEAIVEKFTDMSADLDRERKAMTRLWAKREAQIDGVIAATVGMYGDLQGIAGQALEEIEGLELPLLDGPDDPA